MSFSPSNLGVIICSHVFEASRPILLVTHDSDGWNFACGGTDHGDDDFHNVGVGHLTSRDSGINDCADLQCGYIAERQDQSSPWVRDPLPVDGL